MNPYSALKGLWHLDRVAALRAGTLVAPVHVQMILSDLCNQDCGFCAYRSSSGLSSELYAENGNHNPKRFIPTDKALEILHDCRGIGVRAIEFTGGGEPTVHPDFERIAMQAQSLGFDIGLVSNGILLRPQEREELCARMAWIRISVDAGTPEQYAAVRRHDGWARAWRTIAALSALPRRGTLGVGFVITRDNLPGLARCAELARDAGADYLRVSLEFQTDGARHFAGMEDEIRRQCEQAAAYATPSFAVHNLSFDRLSDLGGPPDYDACRYQRLNCYIGGDLTVYRCCNTAYTTRGAVGSLKHRSFYGWWKDSQQAYEPFNARQCRFCQFNAQNAALNYVAGTDPMHVNFV